MRQRIQETCQEGGACACHYYFEVRGSASCASVGLYIQLPEMISSEGRAASVPRMNAGSFKWFLSLALQLHQVGPQPSLATRNEKKLFSCR